MARAIPQEQLHVLVARAIEEIGSPRVGKWRMRGRKVAGYSPCAIYDAVRLSIIHGKPFHGCGTWNKYLTVHHPGQFLNKSSLSDDELNKIVNIAIQTNIPLSSTYWRDKKQRQELSGRNLCGLFNLVASRRRNGKSHLGYGGWDKYLEEKHGVVALGQWKWSPERLHRTIAVLSMRRKFDPNKINWREATTPVIHGKSLSSLQICAIRLKDKKGVPFAGQKTWGRYVAWTREKYGGA